LESLETLSITGWNADYLQTFREMLEREGLAKKLAPLRVIQQRLPSWTYVPQTPKNFDCSAETWLLDDNGPRIILDLRPQVVSLAPGSSGVREGAALAGESTTVTFDRDPYADLVDIDRLYAEAREYKIAKSYWNVYIPRESLQASLVRRCELRMLKEEARDTEIVHRAASRALKTYLDKSVRLQERRSENSHAQPAKLVKERLLTEVRLLRNLPKKGVGLFSRSGFYPDFILWIRNKKTKTVRVIFLDPHGLHHKGVIDNDRFAAIEKLRDLGKNKTFKTKKVTLDGYILAPADTSLDNIPGAKEKTWNDLEREYPLLRQGDSCVARLFSNLP
jgi:hypothetical protein